MDSQKLLWHPDRVHAWLQGESISPLYLDMGITRSCNLRCTYCYYAVGEHRTPEIIETGALIRFLREAAEIGVKAIGFLGDGEPLLHPGVYDALTAGHAAGLDMAIATNGTLLKHERLDDFLSSLTWLRFNISAATPATYRSVMGAGEQVFERVVGQIRACVARKLAKQLSVTIGIQMVLVPDCVSDIVRFAQLGRDLGVDYAVIKQCADRTDHGSVLTSADYEHSKPLLEEAEALSTAAYQVIVKWRKITNQGLKKYDRCYGCEFLPQISGNGDLYSCGAHFGTPRFYIGNVNRESFKDLVLGKRYAEVMRRIRTEVDVHRECGTNCRQNEINEFLWRLKQPPAHVNFI